MELKLLHQHKETNPQSAPQSARAPQGKCSSDTPQILAPKDKAQGSCNKFESRVKQKPAPVLVLSLNQPQ